MIRTDKLTKRFGRLRAVEEVSFTVPEGSIFALLGPNGAGKTTLMKTLLNIFPPDGGAAFVMGVDSRRVGYREFRQIGYVSENQQLPDWMHIDEFFGYCSRFYPGWDELHAGSLARSLRLPRGRKVRALSRGMRLKAALVAALAYRPKLLLLDEPFSGLDVLVRDELCETVLSEAPGLTILLTSHDLADLESFASHVGYMHEGRLLFSEELPDLASRYRGVEVTLNDGGFYLPHDWPPEWLPPEHTDRLVRFTDTQFDAERVRRYFPNAREIRTEQLSLRQIFVALARAGRGEHDLARS
jgi:ABC-2 type transport system ATP-binding protein